MLPLPTKKVRTVKSICENNTEVEMRRKSGSSTSKYYAERTHSSSYKTLENEDTDTALLRILRKKKTNIFCELAHYRGLKP